MKTKVLMVCLGNICRSPLAEGVLKSKIDLSHVFVDSAGTAGYHVGKAPDKRSIAVAKKHGLDISNQVCRKLKAQDLEDFDMIFSMDKSNYENIIGVSRSKEQAKKVRLLLSNGDAIINEVPDPYYGGEDGFEHVYQLINDACNRIAKEL
ncbi:low molecular weight protein-tyrosine-phosphatase [Maribacter aestuarii]|uniref:low molecular weight protein-tyrosine-phosphatase n=1 Tax=Maribacter aestuarii TaxID=1130723 RepID=UPI00248C7B90|nr:low molecular weight protein-tyrosine-phosphatase [Maribacter aestuarii]